jgi:hypothetical protein
MGDARLLGQIGAQIVKCDSKLAFPNARSAYNFDRKHGHRQQRAYSCPICGLWHLTSRLVAKRNG